MKTRLWFRVYWKIPDRLAAHLVPPRIAVRVKNGRGNMSYARERMAFKSRVFHVLENSFWNKSMLRQSSVFFLYRHNSQNALDSSSALASFHGRLGRQAPAHTTRCLESNATGPEALWFWLSSNWWWRPNAEQHVCRRQHDGLPHGLDIDYTADHLRQRRAQGQRNQRDDHR